MKKFKNFQKTFAKPIDKAHDVCYNIDTEGDNPHERREKKKMKSYLEKIRVAQALEELDSIVECAAFDETLTNDEYSDIYSEALKKAQNI